MAHTHEDKHEHEDALEPKENEITGPVLFALILVALVTIVIYFLA